jgi:hypothetical protein
LSSRSILYQPPFKRKPVFPALAGQCQELDNAGIGTMKVPGSFYDSSEFVIIYHAQFYD